MPALSRHACIHVCIHDCIHDCIHVCRLQTCIRSCIQSCIQTRDMYTETCIHPRTDGMTHCPCTWHDFDACAFTTCHAIESILLHLYVRDMLYTTHTYSWHDSCSRVVYIFTTCRTWLIYIHILYIYSRVHFHAVDACTPAYQYMWMRVYTCLVYTCLLSSTNESWHTNEWVISHMSLSHFTLPIYMHRVAHMHVSRHTYECIRSHIEMHLVTHMSESWHTYEWVMAHIWVSHGTQTIDWVMPYTWKSHVTHVPWRWKASQDPLSLLQKRPIFSGLFSKRALTKELQQKSLNNVKNQHQTLAR